MLSSGILSFAKTLKLENTAWSFAVPVDLTLLCDPNHPVLVPASPGETDIRGIAFLNACDDIKRGIVLNTLDVWPFTMGDSKGEGEDLAIPTAMCKKDAGERLLELLKEKKQMEIKFNIREAKDTSCGICLDNYSKGDEIVQLPCLHFYHAKCINAWFKVNNTCPVCRKEIWDEDDKDNQQERQRRNGVRMGQAVSIENMYL